MNAVIEGGDVVAALGSRVLGRVIGQDVFNSAGDDVLIPRGTMIDEAWMDRIEDFGIDEVIVRSAITCETRYGICSNCYGRDLGRGHLVNIGEAVGVIAAQSIGEPGTQLTMRTFHIGGAASRATAVDNVQAKHAGVVRLHNLKTIEKPSGGLVAISRSGEVAIADQESGKERERYKIPYGALLKNAPGNFITLSFLAGFLISDSNFSRSGNCNQPTAWFFDRFQVMKAHYACMFRLNVINCCSSRGRPANMEGTHGQLGTGFADRLRSNNPDCLTNIDQMTATQVPAVAIATNTVSGLAGNCATYYNLINAKIFNTIHPCLINHSPPWDQHIVTS
jgi:hypothetical protein